MSAYATADHYIRIEENSTILKVYELVEKESHDLETTHVKVEIANGDYLVSQDSCSECYEEEIKKGKDANSFNFLKDGFIGSADLRDTRTVILTYYLENCPIYLNRDSNYLRIGSPCAEPCAAPKTSCREVEEI